MTEPKQNPGKVLRSIRREVSAHEKLLEFLAIDHRQLKEEHRYIKHIGGSASNMLREFRDSVISKLEELREQERDHILENTPPSKLVCPHCEYDGEFDADVPEGEGFRILQPVLTPRVILDYDGSRLVLSAADESHDPFDCISDPEHHDFLDNSDDEVEVKFRKMLRGKWIVLCGSCNSYFEAEDIVSLAEVKYSDENPWDSKWRKASGARISKRFKEEKERKNDGARH